MRSMDLRPFLVLIALLLLSACGDEPQSLDVEQLDRDRAEHAYMLLIGRRPERQFLEDPTPHRNSPIALYQRMGKEWQKKTEELLTRSTSTNRHFDPESPKGKETLRAKAIREYGYHSVPYGEFSLKLVTWRDGDPAFLISDLERRDGVIQLRELQEIRTILPTRDTDTPYEIQLKSSGWTKRGAYLHSTYTTTWSYGDSNGCINLYKPNVAERSADGRYDYDVLIKWLIDRQILPNNVDMLKLVVLPFDEISVNGLLPQEIPQAKIEQALLEVTAT